MIPIKMSHKCAKCVLKMLEIESPKIFVTTNAFE